MSLKILLGLEGLPLREDEIMSRLRAAYLGHKEEVTFSAADKVVKVRLSQISPIGLIRGYNDS